MQWLPIRVQMALDPASPVHTVQSPRALESIPGLIVDLAYMSGSFYAYAY